MPRNTARSHSISSFEKLIFCASFRFSGRHPHRCLLPAELPGDGEFWWWHHSMDTRQRKDDQETQERPGKSFVSSNWHGCQSVIFFLGRKVYLIEIQAQQGHAVAPVSTKRRSRFAWHFARDCARKIARSPAPYPQNTNCVLSVPCTRFVTAKTVQKRPSFVRFLELLRYFNKRSRQFLVPGL